MATLVERVREPAFTGENRCWPCTVVNVVLLWMGVTVVVFLGQPALAGVLFLVGVCVIALRGYLVPYTPRFAPQLVSVLPGDPFDHERAPGSLADTGDASPDTAGETGQEADAPSGDAVLETLLETGVLVADGDTLDLDPTFRTRWREETTRLRERELADLARAADDLTPDTLEAYPKTRWGRSYVVLDPVAGPIVLLPHAIAVAELAAMRALEETVTDERIRLAAGRPLRSLLEHCPLCDAELVVSASTCCGEVTPVGKTPAEKLVCQSCSVRLFTFR
ncbi:hypothetical protein [Natronobiforma cellulositropha]|uniref:hypothetical protein n=1 Tax=Natronobiforma cellulositropha TaxID=1679076 RepID=UPI0021D58A08|nr:hypothetical protein [Natronobiforma cellulositropha]